MNILINSLTTIYKTVTVAVGYNAIEVKSFSAGDIVYLGASSGRIYLAYNT